MKGFGFVAPIDGSPDAFLHVSVLSSAGYGDLPDGAELTVDIGEGPRGPQVQRLIDVVGVEPGSAPPHRAPFGDRGGFGDRDRGGFGGRDRGGFGGDRGGFG
ncbi:cold-shock protein, partial [Zavarzinia sp.]